MKITSEKNIRNFEFWNGAKETAWKLFWKLEMEGGNHMRIWIKAHKQASLMLFRRGNDADYERVDRIDAYNHGIAEHVFNGIMNCDFDYAYIRHSYGTIIFTRSTRGNFVQSSHQGRNGEFYYHVDVESAATLVKEFKCGNYITIKKI